MAPQDGGQLRTRRRLAAVTGIAALRHTAASLAERVLAQWPGRAGTVSRPVPQPAPKLAPRPSPASPAASPVLAAAAAAAPGDPQAEAERLVAELRRATRTAGITRDDPMMPLLGAFAAAIRLVATRTTATNRALADAAGHLDTTLALARSTADAEQEQFRAGLAATQAVVIQGVADSIARSADAALTRRVRVLDWSTAVVAFLVVGTAAGGCFGLGYWRGSADALKGVQQTEAGLRAAFSQGPAEAAAWLDLMTWNSGQVALDRCSKPSMTYTENGRAACKVPLWIEPSPPFTAPR